MAERLEISKQVDTTREVLAHTFPDTFPWTLLGYSGEQIPTLQGMLQIIAEGESYNVDLRFKHPFYQERVLFRTPVGWVFICFSDIGDVYLAGNIKHETKEAQNFPSTYQPELHLISNPNDQPLPLDEAAWHLLTPFGCKLANPISRHLATIPIVRALTGNTGVYEASYLDEEAKKNLLLRCVPTGENLVYRDLDTHLKYQVFGRRINVRTQQTTPSRRPVLVPNPSQL